MKIKIDKNEKTNKVIPTLKLWLDRGKSGIAEESPESITFKGLNFKEIMIVMHVIK